MLTDSRRFSLTRQLRPLVSEGGRIASVHRSSKEKAVWWRLKVGLKAELLRSSQPSFRKPGMIVSGGSRRTSSCPRDRQSRREECGGPARAVADATPQSQAPRPPESRSHRRLGCGRVVKRRALATGRSRRTSSPRTQRGPRRAGRTGDAEGPSWSANRTTASRQHLVGHPARC